MCSDFRGALVTPRHLMLLNTTRPPASASACSQSLPDLARVSHAYDTPITNLFVQEAAALARITTTPTAAAVRADQFLAWRQSTRRRFANQGITEVRMPSRRWLELTAVCQPIKARGR